ncbi:hypothetical protein RB195_001250 [Necator americanus]|uniref:Uncharacterized protein n=1 Tax=Necator americanus TaxID=51031 RepID=A0ABR1DDD5_NECAM
MIGDSGVKVEYCPNHCGHDTDPELLKLDEKSELYIVSLLKKGYKCRKVYDIIQNTRTSQPLLHLATLRKIWNIAKKHSLRPKDNRKPRTSVAVRSEIISHCTPPERLSMPQSKHSLEKTHEAVQQLSSEWVVDLEPEIEHPKLTSEICSIEKATDPKATVGQGSKQEPVNLEPTSAQIPPPSILEIAELELNPQSVTPPADYELANTELVSRIEKIIAGFHADVLQIAIQSNHRSYSTLNRALRAMEAARAVTKSLATKISNESEC